MTAPIISQVEDAIQEAIRRALPGVLRTTGTIPGAWDVEVAQRVLQMAPSVWVSQEGFTGTGQPRVLDWRFGVYAVASMGYEEDRRRGTPVEIGTYAMTERIISFLDSLIVPGVGTLQLQTGRPQFIEPMIELGGTVEGLLFGIRLQFPRPDTAAQGVELSDFRQFHGDWDFAPMTSGRWDEWLAQDHSGLEPDAQDDVAGP
ncbi:phage protein Gp37 [Methylomagnum ishizawai]|uniref:phage protein Gp37 n=1 Tax=Methylomagnum ishizawai TaxID=1760988 RepID=UPI001592DC56|nr:phage protein Gp37 [Methylomagnum ishizawai]